MPIPLPDLDDRRFADLVDEGRALLPVLAPEWTDHNYSDPGITLLELFAWLAEQDIYRLNRIADRHRIKFLEMVQTLPEPPRPARGFLAFRPTDPNAPAPIQVRATTEFETSRGGLGFRTLYPLWVDVHALGAVQAASSAETFRELDPAAGEGFAPFGDDPRVGAALYLGFDRPLPPQRTSLYAAMGVTDEADRTRKELARSGSGRLHHSARVTWEYYDRSGSWRPLRVLDGTRAWTLEGHLWLYGPPAGRMEATRVGAILEPYHYVRCRFSDGQFDAAPRVTSLFCHAVEVEQARAVHGATPRDGVEIGRGNGSPNQRLALPATPAAAYDLRVTSRAPAAQAEQEWTRRGDLAAASASERSFVFDTPRAELSFGDGRNGRAPEPEHTFFASFLVTEAERGTTRAARSLTVAQSAANRYLGAEALGGRLEIDLPAGAQGGAAAETLDLAAERAARGREATWRAVTLEDYETLARSAPGARVARAHAVPNHCPSLECVEAPGTVALVVMPSLPAGKPRPSAGLLALVRSRLEDRRVLGTRIEVVGPNYLELAVQAKVRALRGCDPERLRRAVADALDLFLDPLRGGPDAAGWPLGRDVYRAEILQVIDEVAGVDHVLELALIPAGGEPVCGNVCLKPTWLTTSGKHRVEVE
jgi:predicted phage baseplate assembly protein